MKSADLHLHTFFSDGTYSPLQLIEEAKRVDLSAISVVDHDTVLGVEPTLEIGKENGIEVIPGIELTSEYNGTEIHILGYFIDHKNTELIEKLDCLKKMRVERIHKILAKLKDLKIVLEAQRVFDIAAHGTVGRLHIARAMVKEKLVDSVSEAFARFLSDRSPAYVAGFRLTPLEAIKMIKKYAGIPVLAHPYTIKNDVFVSELIKQGLRGIEAYYSEHTQGTTNFYLDLAEKFDLLVTGGSDCHGNAKPQVKIGSIKIPYDLVDKLKNEKESLKNL